MNTSKRQKSSLKKYTTPKSKLIRFFENSRDKWKVKARDAKYQIKLLRKKVKYLEENKNERNRQNKILKSQIQQMKDKEKSMQEEINLLKKNL